MRWNLRPKADATDLARLVFPVPGGPTRRRIGAWSLRSAAGVIALLGDSVGGGDISFEGVGDGAGRRALVSAAGTVVSVAEAAFGSMRERFNLRIARYSRSRFLTFYKP